MHCNGRWGVSRPLTGHSRRTTGLVCCDAGTAAAGFDLGGALRQECSKCTYTRCWSTGLVRPYLAAGGTSCSSLTLPGVSALHWRLEFARGHGHGADQGSFVLDRPLSMGSSTLR